MIVDNILGRDVFWRYWRHRRFEIIGNSEGWHTVAVYARAIPSALETFLIRHLSGSYIGATRINIQRESLTVLIFRLPQSKEVEAIRHPFILWNGGS